MLCIAFFEVVNLNGFFVLSSKNVNGWAPFYACTAAIICLQGTALKSLKLGIVFGEDKRNRFKIINQTYSRGNYCQHY